MATPGMNLLRLFVEDESLYAVSWQSVEDDVLAGSGTNNIDTILQNSFDAIEVYLAPTLATIVKVALSNVSDKKINDEFLLSSVEEYIAEDIENCKPILMRMSDGNDYIAILNREFYHLLLEKLSGNVKQVKFIQPFPYITEFKEGIITVYLVKNNQFIRTSPYEYFLLDDAKPLPVLLTQLFEHYDKNEIILYTEDAQIATQIEQKYKIVCRQYAELNYGVPYWNFYNEKSKRFNIKINDETRNRLLNVASYAGVYCAIFLIFWVINLGYLMVTKVQLERQVSKDLNGIITAAHFSPNLLSQVDEKINSLKHEKGLYADDDALALFNTFLKTMPEVSNSMIQGIQYSSSQLTVFLNSQFNPGKFVNDKSILAAKRISAEINDYKSYKAANDEANSKNNGGGVLSNTAINSSGSSGASALTDASWVITLQVITRMDTR